MVKPDNENPEFQLGGINHVALVCADTVKWPRLMDRPFTSIAARHCFEDRTRLTPR